MKTRTRTIQALALATIGGTIWSLWYIVPSVWHIVSGDISTKYLNCWFYVSLGLGAVVPVLAGMVAIRTLLKFRKLRLLCWLTFVLLIVDLCVFRWRWLLHILGNFRMLAPQWSDLLFVLVYVIPLALLTLRIFGQSDPHDESSTDGETLDAETKTRYGILHGFLLSVSVGLWIGAALLSSSRFGGVAVLTLGIGLGIAWAIRFGRRAGGARMGLIPRLLTSFVRSIADLFATVKHLLGSPLSLGGGLVWKILASLLFACFVIVAIGLAVDASKAGYEERTLLWLAAFEWVFYGAVGALHLWAVASLFSNIFVTRQILARIRFADTRTSDGKGLPPSGRREIPPSGGNPNRLGGWSMLCQILAAICFVLLLPACIVAVFAGDPDVSRAGGIGIPSVLVAFLWWKTWATIFRKQDEASVEARAMEQWIVVSNSGVFDSDPEQSEGSPDDRVEAANGIYLRGLLGLVSIALFALMGFGFELFWSSAARANAVANAIPPLFSACRQIPGEDRKILETGVSRELWGVVMREEEALSDDHWDSAWTPERIGWGEYYAWRDETERFVSALNSIPAVSAAGYVFSLPSIDEWMELGRPVGVLYATDETDRKAVAEREAERMSKAMAKAVPDLIESMVQLPRRHFKIGKYEVTQAQWEAVMGENPSDFKNPDNPVENVSWNDCQEFLRKLNALPAVKQSGLSFRLPTEEEWEYACRAGATGDYCKLSNGAEITWDTLGQVAWFDDNSGSKTHPVGQKQPNAFGLYDMHGNVWEWTSTAGGVDRRVFRGGCWGYPDCYCRSSDQYWDSPSFRSSILGFRLCASGGAD